MARETDGYRGRVGWGDRPQRRRGCRDTQQNRALERWGTSPLQQRETTEGERDDHLEGSTETDRDGQSAGATQRWREISNLPEQQIDGEREIQSRGSSGEIERERYDLDGATDRWRDKQSRESNRGIQRDT